MRDIIGSITALMAGIALLLLGNGLQGTLIGVRAQIEGFSTSMTGFLMSGYFIGHILGFLNEVLQAPAPCAKTRIGYSNPYWRPQVFLRISLKMNHRIIEYLIRLTTEFFNSFRKKNGTGKDRAW